MAAIEKLAQLQQGGGTRIFYNGKYYNSVDEIPEPGQSGATAKPARRYGAIIGSTPKRPPVRKSNPGIYKDFRGPYGGLGSSSKGFRGSFTGGSNKSFRGTYGFGSSTGSRGAYFR